MANFLNEFLEEFLKKKPGEISERFPGSIFEKVLEKFYSWRSGVISEDIQVQFWTESINKLS